MSCQPGVFGSSASPASPVLRTWIIKGGGRACRACSRMRARLSHTARDAGTPIGGSASIARWTSSKRRTRREALTMSFGLRTSPLTIVRGKVASAVDVEGEMLGIRFKSAENNLLYSEVSPCAQKPLDA